MGATGCARSRNELAILTGLPGPEMQNFGQDMIIAGHFVGDKFVSPWRLSRAVAADR